MQTAQLKQWLKSQDLDSTYLWNIHHLSEDLTLNDNHSLPLFAF
jgi:hypothetical protein